MNGGEHHPVVTPLDDVYPVNDIIQWGRALEAIWRSFSLSWITCSLKLCRDDHQTAHPIQVLQGSISKMCFYIPLGGIVVFHVAPFSQKMQIQITMKVNFFSELCVPGSLWGTGSRENPALILSLSNFDISDCSLAFVEWYKEEQVHNSSMLIF